MTDGTDPERQATRADDHPEDRSCKPEGARGCVRPEIVGTVGPIDDTSGSAAPPPEALGLTTWEDLPGKPVCGRRGPFCNTIAEVRDGAKMIVVTGKAEARQALRDRMWFAWVHDDSWIMSSLVWGNRGDFEMPLPLGERQSLAACGAGGQGRRPLRHLHVRHAGQLSPLRCADRAGGEVGHAADACFQKEAERCADWLAEGLRRPDRPPARPGLKRGS